MTGHAHLSIQKTKKYKKYAGVAYKYWYTPTAPSIPYTIKIYLISSMITPKANPEPNKPKQ